MPAVVAKLTQDFGNLSEHYFMTPKYLCVIRVVFDEKILKLEGNNKNIGNTPNDYLHFIFDQCLQICVHYQ